MQMTRPVLMLCALLLPGCLGISRDQAIPDERIPHQASRDFDAYIWVRRPDGVLVEQWVEFRKGHWIAAPQVVEPAGR